MSASQTATSSELETADLLNRLGHFVRRANLLAAARLALIGGAIWIGLILVAMFVDYASELSPNERWFISRISLLATIAGVGVWCIRTIRRTSVGQLAFHIDKSQMTGGQITTGWDLIRNKSTYDAQLTPTLTSRFAMHAIRQSSQRLSTIKPNSVLPIDALKRPAFSLLAVLAIATIISLVSPPLAWIQFKRFAFPSIDTPPFTGIVINLDNYQHSLRYGDDIKIIATVSRKISERLELVTVGQDGKERVLPMLPRGEAKWQALLTDVKEPAQFFARSGRAKSERGEIDVQLTPKIIESIVRITPLAYTRQAIYEGKVPEAGIAGLVGTQVELFLTSNRPLKSGRIQIQSDGKNDRSIDLTMNRVPKNSGAELDDSKMDNTVSCRFELKSDGRFETSVIDIDGLESTDRLTGKIQILVDQRPIVRILEPRPYSLATPDIDLPISISAEDDFGITQLRLYRSLNGSAASPLDLPFDESARANCVVPLLIKQFGLVPGDEIDLFARTEDNDPNGPKGAESPKCTIHIISIAEFQERMLEQRGAEALSAKYEAAQRQLENISAAIAEVQTAQERADADPSNATLQQELQEKLQAATEAAKSAAEAIERLAQSPLDLDIDQELSKMLAEMAEETASTAAQMKQMAESQAGNRPLNQPEQQRLNQLREKTNSDRDQLQEEAIDPLNELSKTLPLMQDKEHFDDIVERQKELSERMQSLADADPNDPSNERRMMEMEASQEELRQELNELATNLSENANQLPESQEFSPLKESAQQLADGIKQSGAPEFMSDAQKSLLKSKFMQAAENAKAAAESLDSLLPQNDSMGQGAAKSIQSTFQKPGNPGQSKLGRTLDQLKERMNRKGNKPGNNQGNSPSSEPGENGSGLPSRSSRPSNMGLYGSMPTPQPSSRGRSDKVSKGTATQAQIAKQDMGQSGSTESQSSDATGQSQQNVPAKYRQRVSDYYRRINDLLKPDSSKP